MRITTQQLTSIKPQLADLLANLKVGDTVKGKLIEMLGQSISIKTASGQVLTAALTKSAELQLGQMLELNIQRITDEGIFAELKADNKMPKVNEEHKLQQLLKQMDIKPEQNNLQAAKMLLKFNMPVTKENILQLAATQKSIEGLSQGDATKAVALLQSQLNIQDTEMIALAKMTAAMEPKSQELLQTLQQDDIEIPAAKNPTPMVETEQNQKEMPTASREPHAQKTEESNSKAVMQKVTSQMDEEVMKQEAPKVEKLVDNIVKVFETLSKAKPEQAAYMFSKEIKVTPGTLKAAIDHISGENKLAVQIEGLEKIMEHLEKNNVETKELKQELKKLFLSPEQLQDKEKIAENFKEVVKFAAKLETIIKEQGLENKVDNTMLQDLKNNLDFTKSIHANMNYIQIPIQLNESKTTAEIYVFNDKKKSKVINPENATILIALDLNRLGHLESLITVTKKNVNITFKVEKEEIKKIISEGAGRLAQALEARGYNLSPLRLIDIQEKFSLLELEEMTRPDLSQLHVDIKV